MFDSSVTDQAAFTTNNVDPIWDAETITHKLETHLSKGLPSALSIRNSYVEALSHRDESCPSLLAPNTLVGTWEGGCSTETHYFYGTGIFFEVENTTPEIPYEMSLQSSFEIMTQNEHFIAGGISTRFEMIRGAEYLIEETIGGTYQYENGPQWLQEGISASFRYEIITENNHARGYLDGGVSYLDLSLEFSMLQFDHNDCDYPFGDLFIRDPTGMWFTLQFTDCSGCGTLSWMEAEIDRVCIGDQLWQGIDTLSQLERE